MKNKIIIISTIFSLFLLLMVPNISAVQTHTIEERLLDKISEEQLQFIKDKIQEYKDEGFDIPLILFKIIMACILIPLTPIMIIIFTIIELWRIRNI